MRKQKGRDSFLVAWQGVTVGRVKELEIDNAFLYGKWFPYKNSATEKFLEALKEEKELEIYLHTEGEDPYQGIKCYVEGEPDEWIHMVWRPKGNI